MDETHRCAQFKQLCENSEECLRQILNENVDNKNWFQTETPFNQVDINVKTEFSDDNIDDLDEKFYSSDNDSDNVSENEVEIDEKVKTVSVRQARITWVMSLESEKCDTSKFLCKLCDKTLVNLNSLARHMQMHDENRKFVAECEICNKGFYENSNFLKHMRTHNKNTKLVYLFNKYAKYEERRLHNKNRLTISIQTNHLNWYLWIQETFNT